MSSSNQRFTIEYVPLSPFDDGALIGRLLWDERIFGFPVADLQFRNTSTRDLTAGPALSKQLVRYCQSSGTELISARSSATDSATYTLLCEAGFKTVDFALTAQIHRPKIDALPPQRLSVRPAESRDAAAICAIAHTAFSFGRYHTDPRFPRHLANQRYVAWIQAALNREDPHEHVLVLGQPNSVIGFMNVTLTGGHADLRLAAIDPDNEIAFAGYSLYLETMRAVHIRGAKSISAKISAANTRILNLCAMLGFQFSNPEMTLHWHSPEASHLVSVGAVSVVREGV
ncbi:MAG: hypothetical protein HYX27_06180 [Acidobacteria bacterium]|nr:hypothetical protein [Acidobacteriota bacterium]